MPERTYSLRVPLSKAEFERLRELAQAAELSYSTLIRQLIMKSHARSVVARRNKATKRPLVAQVARRLLAEMEANAPRKGEKR